MYRLTRDIPFTSKVRIHKHIYINIQYPYTVSIYNSHLTRDIPCTDIPCTFKAQGAGSKALAVPVNTYTPYNAQATVHTYGE